MGRGRWKGRNTEKEQTCPIVAGYMNNKSAPWFIKNMYPMAG